MTTIDLRLPTFNAHGLNWLLGDFGEDGFAYAAHHITCTDGLGARWCVKIANAEVTVCGRHASPNRGQQATEVFTTCHACGQAMAAVGRALAVPVRVANDAAFAYWEQARRAMDNNEGIEA